jgi:hypothetical protein
MPCNNISAQAAYSRLRRYCKCPWNPSSKGSRTNPDSAVYQPTARPLLHRVAPPTPSQRQASLTESPARRNFVELSLGTFGAALGSPLFLCTRQNQKPRRGDQRRFTRGSVLAEGTEHEHHHPFFTRGSVLAEGTEHEHHHPFLAASRSGRGFTMADLLVRITTVAVLVGALVERDAGGSARHVSGRRHDPHRDARACEYAQHEDDHAYGHLRLPAWPFGIERRSHFVGSGTRHWVCLMNWAMSLTASRAVPA